MFFIKTYITSHNYPPTIREIAEHFAISVKGAYDHVAALKKKGYIKSDKRSRTMELIKNKGDLENNDCIEVPILGSVAAGIPIMAEENRDGSVMVHHSWLKKHTNYFAVRVKGDSMIGAGIIDGDKVLVEQCETAENGEIVIAMVNDAMTLKRFFQEKNRVRLQPENEKYRPIYSQETYILGRVAHVIRSY